MTQQEIFNKLNNEAKLTLKPSLIHGVGVFALRNISKGDKVYADQLPGLYQIPRGSFSKLFEEVKQEIWQHWATAASGSKFMYPFTPMQAYINHSDDPNYDCKTDLALKDIKEGEELTENYRSIAGYQHAFPWLEKN